MSDEMKKEMESRHQEMEALRKDHEALEQARSLNGQVYSRRERKSPGLYRRTSKNCANALKPLHQRAAAMREKMGEMHKHRPRNEGRP